MMGTTIASLTVGFTALVIFSVVGVQFAMGSKREWQKKYTEHRGPIGSKGT